MGRVAAKILRCFVFPCCRDNDVFFFHSRQVRFARPSALRAGQNNTILKLLPACAGGDYRSWSKAASKARLAGGKSSRLTNSQASLAP